MHIFLSVKEYCKVIFPYEAQNDDELTIKEGDIVMLLSKVKVPFSFYKQEYSFQKYASSISSVEHLFSICAFDNLCVSCGNYMVLLIEDYKELRKNFVVDFKASFDKMK